MSSSTGGTAPTSSSGVGQADATAAEESSSSPIPSKVTFGGDVNADERGPDFDVTRLQRQLGREMSVKIADADQDGLVREQIAEVRPAGEAAPMGYVERKKRGLFRLCRKKDAVVDTGGRADVESANANAPVQYRLTARKKVLGYGIFGRLLAPFRIIRSPSGSGGDGWLLAYLSWTFHASFTMVFLSMLATFMTLVTIYAAFLMLGGALKPECVYVSGSKNYDKDSAGSFGDLFQLSWTTFSTVGYGHVFPSTSVQTQEQMGCSFVQFLCTTEAFVGVLFAGFCGAILFGKVLRIQSHAKVVFSDPVCIRYGSGLNEGGNDSDGDDDDDSDEEEGGGGNNSAAAQPASGNKNVVSRIPCPVLEFRVINQLYNQQGGEIMDSTLTCVSAIVTNSGGGNNVSSTLRSNGTSSSSSSEDDENHHEIDEGDTTSSSVCSKWIFSTVNIESPAHPFFKRVWNAKHVLNEESPLLKTRVKKMIQKNKGFWPSALNTSEGIRKSIRFNHVIVSFSGVSNISGASVYAQKVYDFVDVNVGYQFAPVLYRNEEANTLSVDLDMINDVIEQDGGGGEPLVKRE